MDRVETIYLLRLDDEAKITDNVAWARHYLTTGWTLIDVYGPLPKTDRRFREVTDLTSGNERPARLGRPGLKHRVKVWKVGEVWTACCSYADCPYMVRHPFREVIIEVANQHAIRMREGR